MMSDFQISCRFSNQFCGDHFLWLARQTDWLKLLHLPDVSWLQLMVAAACLVVVIWGIVRLTTRLNEDVDPAEADREMLQALNDLRREGDLTEDEFRSIKGQITGRLNTAWKASSTPETTAKSAGGLNSRLLSSKTLADDAETGTDFPDLQPEATQSTKSETFASPTNVPEPSQDTSNTGKGPIAPESEKGDRNGGPGPDENTNNTSQGAL